MKTDGLSAAPNTPPTLSSPAMGEPALAARPNKLRFGLVPRVVALVVLVVISAGALISAVMVRQNQDSLRAQIIANNLASAELAAEFAHRYIEGVQISVHLLARAPYVEQAILGGRFDQATPFLQAFLKLNNRVDGCSIFDAKGINRATGNLPATGLGNDSTGREWFRAIMASGEPYLGIPVVSRGTGRPAVPYGVPVFAGNGEIKGVVLCGISLAALNDAIARFSTGPSARASLADRRGDGIILAHPERSRVLKPASGLNQAVSRMLKGERGAMETASSTGELNLTVFAPVPNLPWGVILLQPSDAVFAPVARSARQGLLYSGILLLITAAVGGLLARRVTRPLIHLRQAASRFAAGDMSARVNISRQDEVGDLGRSFDRMATALAERSTQLQAANDELQSQYLQVRDANRLKSEFLANMSHELRTPLNAVIGFAQLIHDGRVGPVTADQQEYLHDILTSADHLLQLINDVLDLAKVESGKLEFHPEPVQLPKLIAEVRSILKPLAVGKRLTVDVDLSAGTDEVILDPAKLKQVLYNYLSNAIKFTAQEGRITVRARPEEGAYFRLEVEDDGIGIAADQIAKLFVPFQQLESGAAKKHQGTGLGLALTRKIVEAQGGRVGVDSARGRGSIFYAILPRVAGEIKQAAAKASPETAPTAMGPAVLIVEDNEADLNWLTQTLCVAGYCVDSARTGAEAVAKAQARAYSAVLLDLILPDTGGWDILHSIRTAGPNESTPVIVVSVVAEKGVAKGFPVQDYLVKPVRSDALLDALRSAGAFPRGLRRQVMVVDDDVKALKLAKAGLQAGGYEAACYADGASALDDAKRLDFAAVVLDLLMPHMDGFEFLDRFRQIDQYRNTPVIVWTNKDITAAEMERLRSSAQTIALKDRDGIAAVLRELRRHNGPAERPPPDENRLDRAPAHLHEH